MRESPEQDAPQGANPSEFSPAVVRTLPNAPLPASSAANAPEPLPFLPYSFSQSFSQGRAILRRNYGLLLLGALIAAGGQTVESMGGGIVQLLAMMISRAFGGGPNAMIIAMVAWSLGTTVFLAPPLTLSMGYTGVAAWRNKRPEMQTLFRAFYRYWPGMGVYWLTSILVWIATIIAGAPAITLGVMIGTDVLSNAWWWLFGVLVLGALLVGAYLYVRWSAAWMLVLDEQAGPKGVMDAMRTSWQWTKGCARSYFLLCCFMLLIMFATLVVLLLPALFLGLPLVLAMSGAAYIGLGVRAGIFPNRTRCVQCDYDLTGNTTGICPECGTKHTLAVTREPLRQSSVELV